MLSLPQQDRERFNPLKIPNIVLYLDPQYNDFTLNLGNISQMNDASPEKNNGSQGTAANQSQYMPGFPNVSALATTLAADSTQKVAASVLAAMNISTAWTIGFWFYKLSTNDQANRSIFHNTQGSSDRIAISTSTNETRIRVGLYNGSAYIASKSGDLGALNRWSYVLASWNGSDTLELYIDNTAQSGTIAPVASATAGMAFLNGTSGTVGVAGRGDTLSVWDKVLDATEREQAWHRNGDVARDNLLLEWKLDEASGSTALDSSGNGHDGTITGATYVTTNIPGGINANAVMVFDGSNDALTCGTLGSLGSSLNTGVMTIVALIQTFDTSRETLCGLANTGTTTFFQMMKNTTNGSGDAADRVFLEIRDNDANLLSGHCTFNLDDGNAHILIVEVTPSANLIRYFIDGTQQATTNVSAQTPDNFSNFGFPLAIGARNLRGTIDNHAAINLSQFDIVQGALSTAQRTALERQLSARFNIPLGA